MCPNVGTDSTQQCTDRVKCGLRHQSESMRVDIIEKLRKAFEDVERVGPYDATSQLGDPTWASIEKEYMANKRQEQGMSGVRSKKARHISWEKMDKLMINL